MRRRPLEKGEVMTDADRDRIRALQDRWLERFARRLEGADENREIVPGGPTLKQVRECICPGWEWWFHDQLREE